MLSFKVRKIGPHWYPDINHDPNCISTFDEKLNRYFNIIDTYNWKELTIEFEELGVILDGHNIIYFEEQDIVRYLTTDDEFNIRYMINGHIFEINSDLYWLLEKNFNFNFHKEVYRVNVY